MGRDSFEAAICVFELSQDNKASITCALQQSQGDDDKEEQGKNERGAQ